MRFIHLRKYDKNGRIKEKGGRTAAWWFDQTTLVYTSIRCYDIDGYCKALGRKTICRAIEEKKVELIRIPADELISAFIEEAQLSGFTHDYDFPDLAVYNISYGFINSFVSNRV